MSVFEANPPSAICGYEYPNSRTRAARLPRLAWSTLILTTLAVAALTGHLRYTIAAATPWQCDEIPLLVRSTGLCGYVTNEQEAQTFTPTYYTAYMGALRSLRTPKVFGTLHTTAGFWTNLTVHLFGANPLGGRIAPLVWSLVAMISVSIGAFLVTRSLVASCVAILVVGLSPHAIAYSAQARGYSEALALAPLLLIAWELMIRRPQSWVRSTAVMIVSLQLSLTLYTTWVYWVLPILLLALWLPQTVNDLSQRKAARTNVCIVGVGLVAFMSLFTIDRWDYLSRQASSMGRSIDGLADAWRFIQLLGTRLFFEPISIVLLAVIGVAITWRTRQRWWVLAVVAGMVVPAAFAVVNGSAGYTRNFGYLVGPVAISCGVGADALWRYFVGRYRRVPVTVTGLAMFLLLASWGYAGATARARALLLPDWGEVVLALEREPETDGPRWFCRDLANHWQINWYETPQDHERFLEVPSGDTIEVVMGAQYDDNGRATIFRNDAATDTLPQVPLPAYLAAIPPSDIRAGIELRRWVGRERENGATSLRPQTPVLALFQRDPPITVDAFRRFLIEANAQGGNLVTFKPVPGHHGLIHSMMAPFAMIPDLESSMRDTLGVDRDDVHWFELQPRTDPERTPIALRP